MDEAATLQGRRILVIEDDYLVGIVLADLLEEAGAEVVGPIGEVDEAVTFIKDNGGAFDSAVLDVNLNGRKSYPIADALVSQSISFVFTTGYGAEAIDEAYRRYPRCEKPISQDKLIAALTEKK
jgi:DNA-binding NtrC family response regulator